MARTHRVSPLPEPLLRTLAGLLREIADVYETAAKQLIDLKRESLPVEKFAYLRDGLDYLLTHAEQSMDWQTREKLWKAYEQFQAEPLPAESYDRTKGGKPPAKSGPMGTTQPAGVAPDAPEKPIPTKKKKKGNRGR